MDSMDETDTKDTYDIKKQLDLWSDSDIEQYVNDLIKNIDMTKLVVLIVEDTEQRILDLFKRLNAEEDFYDLIPRTNIFTTFLKSSKLLKVAQNIDDPRITSSPIVKAVKRGQVVFGSQKIMQVFMQKLREKCLGTEDKKGCFVLVIEDLDVGSLELNIVLLLRLLAYKNPRHAVLPWTAFSGPLTEETLSKLKNSENGVPINILDTVMKHEINDIVDVLNRMVQVYVEK